MPFSTVGLWYFTISFTCRLSHPLWFPPDVQHFTFPDGPRIETFISLNCSQSADIDEFTLVLFNWTVSMWHRRCNPLSQICNELRSSHLFYWLFLPAFWAVTPVWVSFWTRVVIRHAYCVFAHHMCDSKPCMTFNVTMGTQGTTQQWTVFFVVYLFYSCTVALMFQCLPQALLKTFKF